VDEHRYEVEVLHLLVSPGHNYFGRPKDGPGSHPSYDLDEVRLAAGKGIVGDRFFGQAAHLDAAVTLFAVEALEAIAAELAWTPSPTRCSPAGTSCSGGRRQRAAGLVVRPRVGGPRGAGRALRRQAGGALRVDGPGDRGGDARGDARPGWAALPGRGGRCAAARSRGPGLAGAARPRRRGPRGRAGPSAAVITTRT
jgi:hypothetical protein